MNSMMERIAKVWFSNNRIYIKTENGIEKSRPLEAFPLLMDASDGQRSNFFVWADGQSIRWEEIDEDIHLSAFDESTEPNRDNDVAKMLESIGVIDVKAFAEMIGIRKSKFDLFRYGIWTPSKATMQKIKDGLRLISNRIATVL